MERSHGIRAVFTRKWFLALNFSALAFIAWGFGGEHLRNRSLESEVENLRMQAERLETRNLELADLARRLSEPELLEREARLKLNLRKPGEEVVVVRDAAAFSAPVGNAEHAASFALAQAGRTESNPRKWLRYFFQ